jgi:acylphosphatase
MNAAQPTRCRRRIVFAGRVQGVGFRYTVASAARTCRVNGYVRNCLDGTVELLAEGTADSVGRLLHGLGESFPGNIENQTVEELDFPEQFDSFEIRR